MSIQRIEVGPRMSQAVVHGDTVYLAGQVANKPVPSVGKQTKQILAQIDKLLKQAGSNKSKILSANIWLTDMRGFGQMNEAWEAWIPKGQHPCPRHGRGQAREPGISRRDHADGGDLAGEGKADATVVRRSIAGICRGTSLGPIPLSRSKRIYA